MKPWGPRKSTASLSRRRARILNSLGLQQLLATAYRCRLGPLAAHRLRSCCAYYVLCFSAAPSPCRRPGSTVICHPEGRVKPSSTQADVPCRFCCSSHSGLFSPAAALPRQTLTYIYKHKSLSVVCGWCVSGASLECHYLASVFEETILPATCWSAAPLQRPASASPPSRQDALLKNKANEIISRASIFMYACTPSEARAPSASERANRLRSSERVVHCWGDPGTPQLSSASLSGQVMASSS